MHRLSCWADPANELNQGIRRGNSFFDRWLTQAIATAHWRSSLRRRELLPVSGQENARGSWWMLALVVEGLVMLGEQSQAGQLYPLVRELIDTGAVALWPISRFTQTIAGIAAAAAGQWEAAEDHFRIAMAAGRVISQSARTGGDTPLPRDDADRSRRGRRSRKSANAARSSGGDLYEYRHAASYRDDPGSAQPRCWVVAESARSPNVKPLEVFTQVRTSQYAALARPTF